MRVEVSNDSHWIQITWLYPGRRFTWAVVKMIDMNGPPEPAEIAATKPARLTAETAVEQAKLLRRAAGIARSLDEAVTCAEDFKRVEVVEMETWTDDTHIARARKIGGAVLIYIPKQS